MLYRVFPADKLLCKVVILCLNQCCTPELFKFVCQYTTRIRNAVLFYVTQELHISSQCLL